MNVQCPSCSTTFPGRSGQGAGGRCPGALLGVRRGVPGVAWHRSPVRPQSRDRHRRSGMAPPPPPPPPAPPAASQRPHPGSSPHRPPAGRDAGDAASDADGLAHPAGRSRARARRSRGPARRPLPQPVVPPRPAAGGRSVNPFLSQDPSLKARRLARALVSDMVVYHPGEAARRAQGRDGEGVVRGRDHEELGGVRGAGGPRARRLDALLPGSAERDPGRREPDLLSGRETVNGKL